MMAYRDFRGSAAGLLALLALVLSGCFVTPGRFTSELHLTGGDRFTFKYEGEIFFLGLSKLAQMGGETAEDFTPSCYNDETFEARECTPEEEAAQRTEFEAEAEARATQNREQAKQLAAIMGGIDPTDPRAAEELTALLQRQNGWERVVHKGDGLFDVSYSVSGTLGHDFMFPTIEGFPATNPFVQTVLRKGRQVRINAPALTGASGDGVTGNMFGMGSLAGLSALGSPGVGPDGNPLAGLPEMNGTFTIRLAPGMRILANNTDAGPVQEGGGEALRWTISPRTRQAPTALIVLTP